MLTRLIYLIAILTSVVLIIQYPKSAMDLAVNLITLVSLMSLIFVGILSIECVQDRQSQVFIWIMIVVIGFSVLYIYQRYIN